MKTLLFLLAVLAVAYATLVGLALLLEKRLIFFPEVGRTAGEPPSDLPVEDVWLRTADGVRLHAWWIPAGAEFTFLAFHGNAANIASRAPVYRFLRRVPADVLAVEYRGYGRSEGAPSETGLYRDAEAAWDWLVREKQIPPQRIIVFGQSLGTAVAAYLAARREVGGVVLEAPFASVRAVARRVYWFLPGIGCFLRTKFDTGANLAQVSAPVLMVHCSSDPVLPFALGEEVFRLAREPKMFLRIEGHCHEEASQIAPEQYREALRRFLGKL
jgi:fermentation-respiration switch protein FrsA (DUF1100 family)